MKKYRLDVFKQLYYSYVGLESKEILPYLYKGLRDKSPAVRRTAGDCISDLGYPEALPEMVLLLDDTRKSLGGVLLCLSLMKVMQSSFPH